MKKLIILIVCFGFIVQNTNAQDILTPKQLANLRIASVIIVEDSTSGINPIWHKPKIDSVFQAIENWWGASISSTTKSGRLQLNDVMNTEASNQGFSLTVIQKKAIFTAWMRVKIKQEIGR